jgi:N-acetylmuramoyl-L-alanine amidase
MIYDSRDSKRKGGINLSKPIILIDPGHGGSDPGVVFGNYLEKNWVLDISLYMAEELKNHGFLVSLTRSTDISLSPSYRAGIVRESGALICLSNHINAGGGEGVEIIYSLNNDKSLAELILEELGIAGMKKRKVYTRESLSNPGRDYYYMHRDTAPVETVIVEYGFMDNEKDRSKLIQAEFRKELAMAAVRGVINYLALSELDKNTDPKIVENMSPVFIIDANGTKHEFPKSKTKLIQDHIYLEGRELTNILGGKAIWDGDTKSATFDLSNKKNQGLKCCNSVISILSFFTL